MAYELTYAKTALKQLKKLDRAAATRIVDYMDEVARLESPRARGKALVGDRAGLWRYRVGDYRVLCELDDGLLLIVALEVGHRSQVYE